MLCHVLAAMNDQQRTDPSPAVIGGVQADLALEMIRNQDFYRNEDLYSLLDRVIRLWRDYGAATTDRHGGRKPPSSLLRRRGLRWRTSSHLGSHLRRS